MCRCRRLSRERVKGARGAEFALVVGDPWQGQGVGRQLLARLIDVAGREKLGRIYAEVSGNNLRMQRLCSGLGFSIAEISELLKLWQNRRRASGDVKRIALSHVADLDRRMAEMAAMKQTLARLASCCHGDDRPDCPILDELGDAALVVRGVRAP